MGPPGVFRGLLWDPSGGKFWSNFLWSERSFIVEPISIIKPFVTICCRLNHLLTRLSDQIFDKQIKYKFAPHDGLAPFEARIERKRKWMNPRKRHLKHKVLSGRPHIDKIRSPQWYPLWMLSVSLICWTYSDWYCLCLRFMTKQYQSSQVMRKMRNRPKR